MKSIIFSFGFLLISLFCTGQSEMRKKYFDAFWKPLKNSKGAVYYRMASKVDDHFLVKDFYMSGQLQMEALCSRIEPHITTIGKTTLYYESGTIKQEGAFDDDQPIGLHKYYDSNGKIMKEIIHVEAGKRKYVAYYKDGANVLNSGNGNIIEEFPNRREYTEIADSTIVVSYTTYPNSIDTLYGVVDQRAKYKGGDRKLMEDLQANLVYPKSAKRTRVQGMVYIEFVVTKEGKTNKMRILQGLSEDCDNAAYYTVSRLKTWEPATYKGKPVSTLFILPVNFKITF